MAKIGEGYYRKKSLLLCVHMRACHVIQRVRTHGCFDSSSRVKHHQERCTDARSLCGMLRRVQRWTRNYKCANKYCRWIRRIKKLIFSRRCYRNVDRLGTDDLTHSLYNNCVIADIRRSVLKRIVLGQTRRSTSDYATINWHQTRALLK